MHAIKNCCNTVEVTKIQFKCKLADDSSINNLDFRTLEPRKYWFPEALLAHENTNARRLFAVLGVAWHEGGQQINGVAACRAALASAMSRVELSVTVPTVRTVSRAMTKLIELGYIVRVTQYKERSGLFFTPRALEVFRRWIITEDFESIEDHCCKTEVTSPGDAGGTGCPIPISARGTANSSPADAGGTGNPSPTDAGGTGCHPLPLENFSSQKTTFSDPSDSDTYIDNMEQRGERIDFDNPHPANKLERYRLRILSYIFDALCASRLNDANFEIIAGYLDPGAQWSPKRAAEIIRAINAWRKNWREAWFADWLWTQLLSQARAGIAVKRRQEHEQRIIAEQKAATPTVSEALANSPNEEMRARYERLLAREGYSLD